MSTQLIGFSYPGFCRRWLVWPTAMIWPAELVQTALLSTLYYKQQAESGRMIREKFFLITFIGAWCWYWFSSYIFTALSAFNWVCRIAPNNIKVNKLFGVTSGLSAWVPFNYNYGAYLPMLNKHVFDRFGERYAFKTLLTPDGTFNAGPMQRIQKQYLPIPFMLA
ncbi:hypothetical protein OC861_006854 [Tilletia horrida]|nr:hypothetical protein OC861_006854 [Tilletia horrida]